MTMPVKMQVGEGDEPAVVPVITPTMLLVTIMSDKKMGHPSTVPRSPTSSLPAPYNALPPNQRTPAKTERRAFFRGLAPPFVVKNNDHVPR